jgi:RimJ/RimL family protein N-acetyltransferase
LSVWKVIRLYIAGLVASIEKFASMLSVRPLIHSDIPLFLKYWFESDEAFLKGMGLDVSKLPAKEKFAEMLQHLLATPIEQRMSYAIVWLKDEQPIGHSNTNPTTFGEEAKMHLHLWNETHRKTGLGSQFVKLTLPHFFNDLQLKTLWCEPYALNPGPNKTLQKVGFEFVKEHITIPGSFNFEQPAKLWKMTREQFNMLNGSH